MTLVPPIGTCLPLLTLATLVLAGCVGIMGPAGTTGRPPGATVGTAARTDPSAEPRASPRPAATTGGPAAGGRSDGVGAGVFAPTGETESAVVVRVVDGDTIVVDRGHGQERLRYIGIDTPETVDPRQPIEWMGQEASEANRALVEGRSVMLERDVTERDRYDRLLRYVWLREPDGWILVNLELVRLGFAQVVTYPPDVRYVDQYLAAQAEARAAGRGLWGETGAVDALIQSRWSE